MSTLPITIVGSPLPEGEDFTPQELMDAIVARLTLETGESYVLFGTGSVLPVSDQGPFLLDGTTIYVWDSGAGEYVPQTIPFKADINPKPFRANMTGNQTVVFASGGSIETEIDCTEEYDPDGCLVGGVFVAPNDGYYTFKSKVAVAATTGSPTSNIILFYPKKNGAQMPMEQVFVELDDVFVGRTYPIATEIELQAGDQIKFAVSIQTADASTWTIYAQDTWFAGHKIRNLTF